MLWIFCWSIPRHNILEFGGQICSDSLLCGQLLGNQFLSVIVGQGMTALEQDVMDLLLEHTKPQHTRIWLLNVKYLLGQCFMWTTLGNDYQKFLWVIFEYFTIPLSTKLWVDH